MAKIIRDADGFWTINSSPVILASAVRGGKETIFYPERGASEVQNVWRFDGLVRAD